MGSPAGPGRPKARLGLTVVGFATAFELVVLAVAASRRRMTDTVLAGVIGSYAYNATMSLGAGALARPLQLLDATQLRPPLLAMVGALAAVLALALPSGSPTRSGGAILLAVYAGFVILVVNT